MTVLKSGEHTEFTSKNGVTYWVMNLQGKYYVNRKDSVYGMKQIKATKEIKSNIKLA